MGACSSGQYDLPPAWMALAGPLPPLPPQTFRDADPNLPTFSKIPPVGYTTRRALLCGALWVLQVPRGSAPSLCPFPPALFNTGPLWLLPPGSSGALGPVAGSSRAAATAAVTLAGVLQSWRPLELKSAAFSLGSSAPRPFLPDALVMPPRGLRLHPCVLILGCRRWHRPSDQQLGSLPHPSGLERAAALASESRGHREAESPCLTTSVCHGAAQARPQPQPAPCMSSLQATCPPQQPPARGTLCSHLLAQPRASSSCD